VYLPAFLKDLDTKFDGTVKSPSMSTMMIFYKVINFGFDDFFRLLL